MKQLKFWLVTIAILLCSSALRAGIIAGVIDVSASNVSGSASREVEKKIELSEASLLSFDWYLKGSGDYDCMSVSIDGTLILYRKGDIIERGSIKRFLLPGEHVLYVSFSKKGTGSPVAKLTDVTISSNGIIEKDDVFYLCNNDNTASLLYAINKAEIRIPKSIEVDGNTFNINAIEDNAFEFCADLRNVVIEDSNNEILVGCNNTATQVLGLFYNCPLESVYLGCNLNYNSGSSYGYSPFFRTDRYPIVSLGDSVTAISPYLYYNNSSLTTITIPKNVVSIESNAFYGCTNLYKVVNCSNLSFSCGSGDHGSVSYYAKKVVNVNETTAIGDFQFHTSDNIHYLTNYIGKDSRLILPNSFNEEDYKIDVCAFYGYDNIESVIIPESVTSIGDYAFSGCGQLSSITIPSRVTSIGNSAFKGCIRLLSVTIGNSVLSIGSNAFTTTPKKTIWLTNTPPTGYTNAKGSINYVANDQYTRLGNVQVYPYLSSMFEADGVKYVPVSPSERTCHAIDCAYDSTAEIINVSETTSFKGVAMKVTEVMPYTVYGNNHIKEVSVSHLGHIRDYAFYNCDSIKTVNVSNQGNIGSQVFYDCDGIESVNVANLGDIGNQAFYNCDGIKDVNISNLGNIGSQAFYNSDAIESVTISNHGDIGEKAFYDCNGIKNVDIRNQGSIGSQAFYGCNAMETAIVANCIPTLPSVDATPLTFADWTSTNHNHSSTSSKTYTFTAGEGATLSFNWSVSSEASYDKLIATLDGITILEKSGSLSGTYSNAISQGSHTLVVKYTKDNSDSSGSDQASVSNITVGKGDAATFVAGVGSEAFSGCSSLKTVTLGDSIGSLGDKAFYQCSDLQEIVIPDSVKAVGEYCFSGCSAMKSAMIGVGVMTVPSYTFENCTALEDAVIGDGVTAINYYAFTGCTALTNVKLGNSVATINNYAFQNCSSLPEISIPQSTTTIGDYVFGGCSQLADVIIEDRTTALALGSNGSSALFADCPLDSVYIGGKITYNTTSSKGYSPFYRNTSLRTVVITDREEQIYANEFYGCTNLQNVTIGNGVKSIGDYAFSGCSSLEGFSFGSNMETIGAEAFSDCTSLTSITSHAAVPPICGTQALDDINKWGCTLRVPSGYASAYQGADQWKEFFFVDDVVEVAKYTLTFMVDGEVYHTSSLVHKAEVTIPDAPTKEGYTFSGWNNVPATMPAEDVVFNGFFTINKYLVTFKIGDEVISSESLEYGANIVAPEAPEKKGHTFNGWGKVAKTVPASDLTYEGSYSVNSYLLTYMVDGEIVQSDSIAYGTKLVTPKAPTKEGHTFSGWSEVIKEMPAEDTTISGFFTANTYKVYYYADGKLVHTAKVTYGEAIPEYVYEPTIEGEVFVGWTGETYETMPAHDITYKAEIEIRFITLAIDQYGSGTFCSAHTLDFSEVEGLKAYVATGYNTATGEVTLTRVMTAKPGEGLFLKGKPGDYEVPTLKSSESCMQNLLVGTLGKTIVNGTSEDGLCVNYKYTVRGKDTTPLFYRFFYGSVLEAGKAYLQLPKAWIGTEATRAAISLRFDDEEMELGNEEQSADVAAPAIIYDLKGRRVANPTKGVFIVNGKKVVFK